MSTCSGITGKAAIDERHPGIRRYKMNRILKKFHSVMTAITFAEAGEFETAIEEMKKSAADDIKVKDLRLNSLDKAKDNIMEAVTFAEAGEQEYSKNLLEETKTVEEKILVVGDGKFSPALTKYSIDMAERLGYGILAVNVIPVKNEIFKLFSEKKQSEMIGDVARFASEFRDDAVARGITFNNQVLFGNADTSIKKICREEKKVLFVLTEPDEVCDMESQKASIPVYCINENIT
jgi:hypothetical protein